MNVNPLDMEMAVAGILPGKKMVFIFEATGGGQIGTVSSFRDGIVFLDDGRRLRWAAVMGVRDAD